MGDMENQERHQTGRNGAEIIGHWNCDKCGHDKCICQKEAEMTISNDDLTAFRKSLDMYRRCEMLGPRMQYYIDGTIARLDAAEAALSVEVGLRESAERSTEVFQERVRELEAYINEIFDLAKSYPEKIFKEPDFDRMREVLTEAGMPTALDGAHGTWGRHLMKVTGDIARKALEK